MSRRSTHAQEMRIALERGCSLDEARREMARLRHRAAEATLRQAQGERVGFASLDEWLSTSLDPARDEQVWEGLDKAKEPSQSSYWWVDHD